MVTQTQTRTIIIKTQQVGGKDFKRVARDLRGINRSVKDTTASLSKFRRVFVAGLAAIGIGRLARTVDSFRLLEDRIKVFTGSAEEAFDTFVKIKDIAKITRTSIENLATTYNRVALATNELGLSNDQLLGTVTALQNTFRLSGATIAEATATAIQLSQGLASGQLRGQELRSVLEQNAVFANLLSKELGVTRGQLIKFAESGKITSQVVLRALGKNFDDLQKTAEGLGTTFGQSLTIAFDAVNFRLAQLSKRLGLSGGFAKGVDLAVKLLDLLIIQVERLGSGSLIEKAGNFIDKFRGFAEVFIPGVRSISLFEKAITALDSTLGKTSAADFDKRNRLALIKAEIVDVTNATQRLTSAVAANRRIEESGARPLNRVTQRDVDESKARLQILQKAFRDLSVEIEKGNAGSTIDQIAAATRRLANIADSSGRKILTPIQQLNRALEEGRISFQDFSASVDQIRIESLNQRFEKGKQGLDQYFQALLQIAGGLELIDQIALGARVGIFALIREVNNVAKQVAGFVRNTFSTLEDSIFDFVKTGTFEFKKFTQAVLDDLTRIIIRAAIIRPLANAIISPGAVAPGGGSSALPTGGGGASTISPGFANGAAFGGGRVIPFQFGGSIVDRPTTFPMAGGNTGLMGEAGPEAILPLTRRGGKLGVEGGASNVQVNIINQANAEVQTQERVNENGDRALDVIIVSTVKGALESGNFDRSFSQNFGLRRQGT